jgi:starch phosphorylase
MWAHGGAAAPIIAITNGVHRGTWQDPRIPVAAEAGDDALRLARRQMKDELLSEVASRTGVRLDSEALTIGFARRAATYKRPDLLLRDPDRLAPLLKNRRVQLVFSGKAHPADQTGKSVVALLIETIRQWPESIVFLEDYDMALGRLLTRGCDVWLNTLNLSILDGWWPEGCEHGVTGWAIGGESIAPDQDVHDLAALYATLEQDVLPTWGDPGAWTRMMRASIRMGVERFSADRMVSEYFDRLYTAP